MKHNSSRRQFLKLSATSIASSTLALVGLTPQSVLAEVRAYKLERATETRNTCTYCAVGCGILMYSAGDRAKNVKANIFHIEGDPDNPVNRGTLCPKGAALLDFVHSPDRLTVPEVRRPGSNKWERITWDQALNDIARLMKNDRDANFVAKNAEGATVNRWVTTGMLAASAASNESGYLTQKIVRSLGMLVLDNQARI